MTSRNPLLCDDVLSAEKNLRILLYMYIVVSNIQMSSPHDIAQSVHATCAWTSRFRQVPADDRPLDY